MYYPSTHGRLFWTESSCIIHFTAETPYLASFQKTKKGSSTTISVGLFHLLKMASPAVVISQITVQVLGAILAPYTLVVLPNSNGSLPPTFPLGDTSGEESQPRIQVPNVGEIPPAIPTPIAVLLEDSGSSSTADTAAALARVAGSLPRGRNQEQYAILVRQGGRGESLTKELKGQAKSLEHFRGKIFVLTGETGAQAFFFAPSP